MRILMIAPAVPDLPALPNLQDEIAAVTSQHNVELLAGEVTERDLARAVGRSETGFDIIWWATHAGEDGIALTRSTLRPSAIIAFVRASDAKLCVFNTCESLGLARAVMEELSIDVIATVIRVDADGLAHGILDSDAMRTGILFSRALLTSSDFRAAYEVARPGGNHAYQYVTSYRRPELALPPWWRWLVIMGVIVILLLLAVLVLDTVFHA